MQASESWPEIESASAQIRYRTKDVFLLAERICVASQCARKQTKGPQGQARAGLPPRGKHGRAGNTGGCSEQVSHVHGHLLDLSVVELLNLTHGTDVVRSHKVDGNTLATEATSSTDSATHHRA